MTREEAIKYAEAMKAKAQERIGFFRLGHTHAPEVHYSDLAFLSAAISALREQEERRWIPVTERLPGENEYVIIWCGECKIARIEKGISKEQRKAMKRGDLDDPVESGWNMSDGYFQLKRSESYRACDEGWNNNVPYCWYVNGGMMKIFGQNVTHWMPIPEPQKEME